MVYLAIAPTLLICTLWPSSKHKMQRRFLLAGTCFSSDLARSRGLAQPCAAHCPEPEGLHDTTASVGTSLQRNIAERYTKANLFLTRRCRVSSTGIISLCTLQVSTHAAAPEIDGCVAWALGEYGFSYSKVMRWAAIVTRGSSWRRPPCLQHIACHCVGNASSAACLSAGCLSGTSALMIHRQVGLTGVQP